MGIDRTLDGLKALGPFFTVGIHGHDAPDGAWQPLTQMLSPDGVSQRIRRVQYALATTSGSGAGDVPWRVAASVAHLGLVARLVSPCLGTLTLALGRLMLDPGETWWQPIVGGPVPLSVSHDALHIGAAKPGGLPDGVIRTLTELFAGESVSPRVLWGNVASAINGAYVALAGARPDLVGAAGTYVQEALGQPLLAGMSNNRPGPEFRRTNCCLIYRLGAQGRPLGAREVCGDCVLRKRSR